MNISVAEPQISRILQNVSITILSGGAGGGLDSDEPGIIVADDLAPSETVQMDKDKILAFVTVHGSANSHTSILAKTMSIPALVTCDISLEDTDGKLAVVDGYEGVIYIDPNPEILAQERSSGKGTGEEGTPSATER